MKSFLAVAIVAAAFAALSLTMKAPYATIVARNAPDTKLETAHGKLIDFKDASAGALSSSVTRGVATRAQQRWRDLRAKTHACSS